jgi:hypothetical protein
MHHTKERLSVLWIFALLNYLYADVVALFDIVGSAKSIRASPPMGSAGFSGLDGNTHRHDSEIDHGLIAQQRLTASIHTDERKQAMLKLCSTYSCRAGSGKR